MSVIDQFVFLLSLMIFDLQVYIFFHSSIKDFLMTFTFLTIYTCTFTIPSSIFSTFNSTLHSYTIICPLMLNSNLTSFSQMFCMSVEI